MRTIYLLPITPCYCVYIFKRARDGIANQALTRHPSPVWFRHREITAGVVYNFFSHIICIHVRVECNDYPINFFIQ